MALGQVNAPTPEDSLSTHSDEYGQGEGPRLLLFASPRPSHAD